MEGRPLDDAELVDRAKQGDGDAYEELMNRYQHLAFRAAYLITGNSADAEDAAQNAFINAYYALGRFKKEAPFRPWFMRIVTNEARNRVRAAGRRAGLELRLAEDRPRTDAAPSPEAQVLAREPRQAVLDALARLSLKDRMVISYRYFLELSEAEMAQSLGLRRGTVKSRLSRALDRLRAELEATHPEVTGTEVTT